MPIYEWKCPECQLVNSETLTVSQYDSSDFYRVCAGTVHHPHPALRMSRLYSFRPAEIFHGHFNNSTGSYVSSMSDLKSQLSRASDEATARNGIVHDFQVREVRDLTPPDISSE